MKRLVVPRRKALQILGLATGALAWVPKAFAQAVSPDDFAGVLAQQQTQNPTRQSTEYQTLRTVRSGRVLIVTLSNPPRNELALPVIEDLTRVFEREAMQKDVGAIVITGENEFFSGGAGRTNYLRTKPNEPDNPTPQLAVALYDRIETYPKVVIAAINGLSQGGGNEMALACDFRIASDTATFLQPEILAGVLPGWGAMQRLQRIVGRAHTLDMMLTAREVSAPKALAMGMVNEVVRLAQLQQRALELATLLATRAPLAIPAIKTRIARGPDEPQSAAIRRDVAAFYDLVRTEDYQNGARALNAGRQPQWRGR